MPLIDSDLKFSSEMYIDENGNTIENQEYSCALEKVEAYFLPQNRRLLINELNVDIAASKIALSIIYNTLAARNIEKTRFCLGFFCSCAGGIFAGRKLARLLSLNKKAWLGLAGLGGFFVGFFTFSTIVYKIGQRYAKLDAGRCRIESQIRKYENRIKWLQENKTLQNHDELSTCLDLAKKEPDFFDLQFASYNDVRSKIEQIERIKQAAMLKQNTSVVSSCNEIKNQWNSVIQDADNQRLGCVLGTEWFVRLLRNPWFIRGTKEQQRELLRANAIAE